MADNLCEHGYHLTIGCTYCGLEVVIDRLQDGSDPEALKFLLYYKEMLDHYHKIDNQFRELRKIYGSDGAKKMAINSLRNMADELEKKSNLGIYSLELPENNPLESMDHIGVTVSYPWGG